MKSTFKKIMCLVLACLMVFSMVACGDEKEAAEEPVAEKRTDLNIGLNGTFASLDPQNMALTNDYVLVNQIYETLVRVDDNNNVVNVLIDGWTLSEDGMSYTLDLKENVAFSNGEIMTASDVKYSIERTIKSPYMSSYVTALAGAEADDAANTVVVKLNYPTSEFAQALTYAWIVNQKFTEENASAETGSTGMKSCGTGAYVYDSSVQDISVTLKANETCHNGAPSIETLNFIFSTDDMTIINALKNGELDICNPNATADTWKELQNNEKLVTYEHSTTNITFFTFNTTKAPFDNKLVRQAFSCAMNRDDLILMAVDGMAEATNVCASPLMSGYSEIESKYPYNVEKARELLAQAGYPDGFEFEIQCIAGTIYEDYSVVLQQQLAEIGVTAKITGLDASKCTENLMTANYDMGIIGITGTYGMSFLNIFYNSAYIGYGDLARYKNEEVEALLTQAMVTTDLEAGTKLYHTILEMVDEDCAYLPVSITLSTPVVNADLDYVPTAHVAVYADASWK